jgi:hypothetical protein
VPRINIITYDELTGDRTLEGHFDPSKCESFDEETRWDGNNNVSVNTGSQWEHEKLYHTPGGRWVLKHWSQWQGVETTYRFLDDDQAQQWLLIAEHDDAVEKYFGEIPDERGPGRPAIVDGSTFSVKFPGDLLRRVDAAAETADVSRAEWLRRAAAAHLTAGLTAGLPYTIQVRDADGTWSGDNAFTGLTDALETRDRLNAGVPDHQSWKQYRVVDTDGRTMQYQEQVTERTPR